MINSISSNKTEKKTHHLLQHDGEADVSGEQLHEILREIDTNMNGQVELDEYLQVGNWIKHMKQRKNKMTISKRKLTRYSN